MYMNSALTTASHAVQINVLETRGNVFGAFAFHWEMLHNVPVQVNLADIQHRQQVKVNKNLMRVNAHCYHHNYCVSEHVMKLRFECIKLKTGGTVHTEDAKFIRMKTSHLNFRPEWPSGSAFAELNLIKDFHLAHFIELNHRRRVKWTRYYFGGST